MFYLSVFLIVMMAFVVMVLVPRGKMQRRAAGILRGLSDYEETSCYLRFSSIWPWRKRRAMEDKIAEMAGEGWIFLKAGEAHPLKTLASWGGGLQLHFVRDKKSDRN